MLLAPTVPYFSTTHLPFTILAIAVSLTFTALPPLLLVLYPFQKMLGCLKIRWHALHISADVFQGCYKNRTDGKNDYRYFAALYFTVRISIFLASIFPKLLWAWMDHMYHNLYCGITAGCSTPPLQEKLAEHFGQSNFSITGSFFTVDTLQFEDRRKMDQFITALPMMYFVVYVSCRFLM